MEIIVEGRKIDTKDIWDLKLDNTTRHCHIEIKLVDSGTVILHKNIPYETRSGEFSQYWEPYENLYKSIKEKWEADKSELQIFKL